MMPRPSRIGDLFAAVLAGIGIELALLSKLFFFPSPFSDSQTLIEFTQKPGAEIAIWLFRYTGALAGAITCAAIINGMIIAALALGLIWVSRIAAGRRQNKTS
jgi:hypothetical protein